MHGYLKVRTQMSKFSEKLLQGLATTDEDWSEHLIEAHKTAPSMTPHAFAPYRTSEGLNSYEILARSIVAPASDVSVLDLACGDGYLLQFLLPRISPSSRVFGVDMSEGELAVARRSYGDPRVSFLNAKAQTLPLPPLSVDLAYCHMAFMLMLPVEPVVSELARVIKPGGKFSAIIGNRKSSGFFSEIQQLVFRFLDSRYPRIKETKSGDPRVQSEDGLKQLFNPDRGFSDTIKVFEFELIVATSREGVWNMMRDMYFIGLLPDDQKEALRKELGAFVDTRCDESGNISFGFPMKKFSVSRI
jgi:SAM-dependent methyltransferase